jgi:hypothetical protein
VKAEVARAIGFSAPEQSMTQTPQTVRAKRWLHLEHRVSPDTVAGRPARGCGILG